MYLRVASVGPGVTATMETHSTDIGDILSQDPQLCDPSPKRPPDAAPTGYGQTLSGVKACASEVGRIVGHVAGRPVALFSSRRGAEPCRCFPKCPPSIWSPRRAHAVSETDRPLPSAPPRPPCRDRKPAGGAPAASVRHGFIPLFPRSSACAKPWELAGPWIASAAPCRPDVSAGPSEHGSRTQSPPGIAWASNRGQL